MTYFRTALACSLVLASSFAVASPQAPDPTQSALVQMVGEAQNREAAALVQVYTLSAKLKAETARADAAEAKLKAAETPAGTAK